MHFFKKIDFRNYYENISNGFFCSISLSFYIIFEPNLSMTLILWSLSHNKNVRQFNNVMSLINEQQICGALDEHIRLTSNRRKMNQTFFATSFFVQSIPFNTNVVNLMTKNFLQLNLFDFLYTQEENISSSEAVAKTLLIFLLKGSWWKLQETIFKNACCCSSSLFSIDMLFRKCKKFFLKSRKNENKIRLEKLSLTSINHHSKWFWVFFYFDSIFIFDFQKCFLQISLQFW